MTSDLGECLLMLISTLSTWNIDLWIISKHSYNATLEQSLAEQGSAIVLSYGHGTSKRLMLKDNFVLLSSACMMFNNCLC